MQRARDVDHETTCSKNLDSYAPIVEICSVLVAVPCLVLFPGFLGLTDGTGFAATSAYAVVSVVALAAHLKRHSRSPHLLWRGAILIFLCCFGLYFSPNMLTITTVVLVAASYSYIVNRERKVTIPRARRTTRQLRDALKSWRGQ